MEVDKECIFISPPFIHAVLDEMKRIFAMNVEINKEMITDKEVIE